MNILFFLTPKSDVDYINEDASLLKTLQKMQERNYSEIPIVAKDGRYVGTIKSGDILGFIKENYDLSLRDSADVPLKNIRRTRDSKAVNANAKIEEMFELILGQNFIPVVDDEESFIGIVTRSDILKFMKKNFYRDRQLRGGVIYKED